MRPPAMKIIFFSRLFYPHIGGVEKHVYEIGNILVSKGHEVTVLTETAEGPGEIDGIKIVRFNNGKDDWFKKFRVWRNIWKERDLIKYCDVLHIHDVFFWYIPLRFILPLKKVFITFHGYEGNKVPGFKDKVIHKIAEKLTNGNICIGDFFKKWYGAKPNFVIYGGANLPKIVITKKKLKNINFLFLGRLEEETGILEYLKALVLLKEKNIKFNLVVLGDGKLRTEAERIAKKNKISVQLKGFKGEISEYLSKCDFVFASRYLAILESLSYKKKVFAVYNNQIKKDYLEMSPFSNFVSISGNYLDLFKELSKSVHNYSSGRANLKGYSWVIKNSWDFVTNKYLSLWR